MGAGSQQAQGELGRSRSLRHLRATALGGRLAEHLGEGPDVPALEIGPEHEAARSPLSPRLTPPETAEVVPVAAEGSQALIVADRRLQDLSDYRGALQGWFRALRPGGRLLVTAPHAFLFERQDRLPSRLRPAQKRLYTAASLMLEVEEALEPNSYRVRLLADDDAGYDYGLPRAEPPVGGHDVVLVLERMDPPAWGLEEERAVALAAPDYAFEPPHVRVEAAGPPAAGRILALKLDHLGDFLMALPALERLRIAFPAAEITLVVGSWNLVMAQELGLFEHVVAFDVFPRNSSEERPDVEARVAAFDAAVTDGYDLAVDLRTDADTRVLLRNVRASVKAGIGTRARFPFLDVFLPLDETRHSQFAFDEEITARAFGAQPHARRNPVQIACRGPEATSESAVVWGPYRALAAGRYLFEPWLEIDPATPGALAYDVALDNRRVADGVLRAPAEAQGLRIAFENRGPTADFEFRLHVVDGQPSPDFRFFGGRLVKEGAVSVIHESEAALLLVELVALRAAGPALADGSGAGR